MGIIELMLLGIGLSMDSFAVSICKGLSMSKIKLFDILKMSFYFAIFHVISLVIGYFFGSYFQSFINDFDHWVAFILLIIIGCNMIYETFDKKKKYIDEKVDLKSMFGILVATTIDALAVGATFAFIEVDILLAVIVIGLIVFSFAFVGTLIGNMFGRRYA